MALSEPRAIDRRAELDALVSMWASVRHGPGRAVVIDGDDASGKSCLVRAFVRRVTESSRHVAVLQAGGQDPEGIEPLAVARRLFSPLHDAIGLAGASEGALAHFADIAPEVRNRFPHLPPSSTDRVALGGMVMEVLDAVVDETSLLLIVDDFERCDVETRRLILTIAERVPRRTLMVLSLAASDWHEAAGAAHPGEPPSVHRIRLEAPPALVPERWGPRWTRAWRPALVATAVVALAASVAYTRAGDSEATPHDGRRRVVVVPFENETGDPAVAALGRIVADWLTDGVARTGLALVSQPILDAASAGEPQAVRARVQSQLRAARADIVITGRYSLTGDSLRFEAQIADAQTGERLGTIDPVITSRTVPLDGVERLRQKALATLAPWVDERMTAAARVQSTPPSYESYLAFATGLDHFYARNAEAIPHFARAYALDTSFTLPLLYEAATRNGLTQFAAADSLLGMLRARRFKLAPYDRYFFELLSASLRGDAPAAYEAARAAAAAAPGSFASTQLAALALGGNRPRETLALLLPADGVRGEAGRLASYWGMVGAAQHMVGDFEGELESARIVRRRFPTDPRYLHYEARALAALGRLRELDALLVESHAFRSIPGWGPPGLRVHITASDELRAHGRDGEARAVLERGLHRYHAALGEPTWTRLHADIARALYQLGRPDEAAPILERLAAGSSAAVLSEIELVALRGYVATARGDRVTAQAIDHQLQQWSDPYARGLNTEIRARMAALLGHRGDAIDLLVRATSEGVWFAVGYHSQFEFASLRGYEPFEEWLRPKDEPERVNMDRVIAWRAKR